MPELPEVETVMRGLAPHLEGHRLVQVQQRRPDLRRPFPERFVDRLEGRTIDRMSRRAKYILAHLDDGACLLIHLGMSGRMMIDTDGPVEPEKHDHMILTTDDGVTIRFNDARRFGVVDLFNGDEADTHPLLAGIGPEPLANSFNGPSLAASLKGRKTPIKAALLDQRIVAGIGNIYASEALFQSGISPKRTAATVQGARAERLAGAVRDVLNAAIASGGSTLRDHVRPNGELGYFQHSFKVYDQEGEPCPTEGCGASVRRIVQSGRSTFYCSTCQR